MTTSTPRALGEAALNLDTEAGQPAPVEFESGLIAQAAVRNPLEPSGKRLPFGWRWIGRLLLLRRWQVMYVLTMTGIIYALSLVFPVCTQKAVDTIVAGRTGLELAVLAAVAVLSTALESALHYWRQGLVNGLGTFLDRRVSRRVFTHLLRLRIDGPAFRSGDTMNHFKQAEKIRDFVLFEVPRALFDFGGALVAMAMCFYYDLAVGIAIALAGPAVILAASKQFRSFEALAENYYSAIGVRQNALAETVNGIATVKALALESARTRRWEATTNDMLTKFGALREAYRSFFLRVQTASRGVTLLVLVVGCWQLFRGNLTIGELVALQLLSGRIAYPLMAGSDFYRSYKDVDVAIHQIAGFVAQPRENAAVRPALRSFGTGGIRISNVSLTYPGSASPALRDITLSLPERGMIAVVGRNGSGKSTLIRVLLGLRRDYSGRVEIGGRDLRDYDPRWLRSRIGVVDQDTVLFAGTVRENLISGRKIHEEVLREALRRSGALDFVEALPGGLDAELAENGRSLSGGQRQRLSIARAFLRDPHFMLLDEPTTFLDAEAAVELEKQFKASARKHLILIVSHHLAATRHAGRILVLEAGRIVGDGPHERLLQAVPQYASLWGDYARSLGKLSPWPENCD
jgi:ABC-type bacteriocin/lantibiotic exporter with double-glycine peptidase domain